MGKAELRVDFSKAPSFILKELFGEAKHSDDILKALAAFGGQAQEKEIFYFLNTDEDGEWKPIVKEGKNTVAVTMQNLRKQLATMIQTGQLKRLGERSARYALPDYAGEIPDEDEGDEEGENGEGVEATAN